MKAEYYDWIAVAGALLFAATWLAFHVRRNIRKKKEAQNSGIGACGSSCEGCPFSKNCGGHS